MRTNVLDKGKFGRGEGICKDNCQKRVAGNRLTAVLCQRSIGENPIKKFVSFCHKITQPLIFMEHPLINETQAFRSLQVAYNISYVNILIGSP